MSCNKGVLMLVLEWPCVCCWYLSPIASWWCMKITLYNLRRGAGSTVKWWGWIRRIGSSACTVVGFQFSDNMAIVKNTCIKASHNRKHACQMIVLQIMTQLCIAHNNCKIALTFVCEPTMNVFFFFTLNPISIISSPIIFLWLKCYCLRKFKAALKQATMQFYYFFLITDK